MGKQTFRINSRKFADPDHGIRGCLFCCKAKTAHPGIQRKMHLRLFLHAFGNTAKQSGIIFIEDIDADVHADHFFIILRPGITEDQDRLAQSCSSELHCLKRGGNRIEIHEIFHGPGDVLRAEAITVGLHDHAKLCPRFKALHNGFQIISDFFQIHIHMNALQISHKQFLFRLMMLEPVGKLHQTVRQMDIFHISVSWQFQIKVRKIPEAAHAVIVKCLCHS